MPSETYSDQLDLAERHMRDSWNAVDSAHEAVSAALRIDAAATPRVQAILWAIQRERGKHAEYFGAAFQDRFLDECIFRGRRGGVFADIGAYNGVTGSNTLFFEKFRGWSGLCVEADAARFGELSAIRNVACVQACVAGQDGTADFFRVRDGFTQMGGLVESYRPEAAAFIATRCDTHVEALQTTRLDRLLAAQGLFDIDYLSLDIEGGELAALRTLDFNRCRITAISVERNDTSGQVRELLRAAGYCRVRRLADDDIFVRGDYLATEVPRLLWDMIDEAIGVYQAGDAAEAEAIYRDILVAEQRNAGVFFNLAASLLAQHKAAGARAALVQALALQPDMEAARVQLSRLAKA